jgi:phage protein D
MNRTFAITGIALVAALAVTGCGGSKKAAKTAATSSAKAAAAAPKSVSGAVVVGRFCTKSGATGATKDGKKTVCVMKQGSKQGRWTVTSVTSTASGAVKAGQFCKTAQVGTKAKSATGTTLTCTKSTKNQAHWK